MMRVSGETILWNPHYRTLLSDKRNELLRHTQTEWVSGELRCVEKASLERLYNV